MGYPTAVVERNPLTMEEPSGIVRDVSARSLSVAEREMQAATAPPVLNAEPLGAISGVKIVSYGTNSFVPIAATRLVKQEHDKATIMSAPAGGGAIKTVN